MKKIGVFLILGLIFAGYAFAGDQDFVLVNETGVEIAELYISPASTDNWGEDVLTVDTLPDGADCDIKFSRNESADFWDLKVVDHEGSSVEWERLKLTAISKVTLTIDNGKPMANVE